MVPPMRVLGVDPGLLRTGYACLEFDAARPRARPSVIEAGVFRLPAKRPIADRLVELEEDLAAMLARTRPVAAAVEGLFTHYERPATAIAMAHARGVILLCLRRAGVSVSEIKPARMKRSITGVGNASKAQVQRAVCERLGLPSIEPADVADAVALALCAHAMAAPTAGRPARAGSIHSAP